MSLGTKENKTKRFYKTDFDFHNGSVIWKSHRLHPRIVSASFHGPKMYLFLFIYSDNATVSRPNALFEKEIILDL